MRKIAAHLEMSLDGVVDHPERWAHEYFAPDLLEAAQTGMQTTDTILLGRTTYEEFARSWPQQDSDTSPFARFMNETRKLVVSSTLTELPWGPAERISSIEEVAEVKQKPGGNLIILGSATLIGSLLRAGLLDMLEIFIVPVLIGFGQRLLETDEQIPLRLDESRPFNKGVVLTRYTPVRKQ
jgi:dihydrofolate reductase